MPANVTPIAAGGPNVVADISFRLFTFSVDPVRAYAITDPTITPATEPPARMRFPENLVSGACLRILVAGYVLIVDPLAVDPFVANGVYLTDQHGVPSQCLRRLGDVTDAAVIAAVSGPRRFTSGRTYYLHWSANPLVVFAYMDELTARMRALGVAEGATATERASRADSVRGVLADFVSRPGFFRVTARQRPSMSINRGRTDFYDFVDADGQFGADHPTLRGALTMVELLLEQARVPRAAEASIWEHSDLDPLARTLGEAGRPFAYDPSGINRFVLAGRETIGVMELAEFADREVRRRLRNAAWGQTSLAAHVASSEAAREGQPLPSRHVQLREAILRNYRVEPSDAAEGLARRHASWIHEIASAQRGRTSASEVRASSDVVVQLSYPPTYALLHPEETAAAEASLGVTKSELFREIQGVAIGRAQYLKGTKAASPAEYEVAVADMEGASRSYYQHYLFGLTFQDMPVPSTGNVTVCLPSMSHFIGAGRVKMDLALDELRATVRRLLARCPMHRVIAEAIVTSPMGASSHEDMLARYLNLTRQWTDNFAVVVPASEDPLLKKVVANVATPLAGITKVLREHYRVAAETLFWQMIATIGGPGRPVPEIRERIASHVEGVTSCMKWFGYVDTPSQLAFGVTAHAALAAGGITLQPWMANPASPASQRQLSAILLGIMEDHAIGGTTRLTQELAETVCKEASALATIRPLAAPAFAEEFVGFVGSAMAVAEFARQFEASERLSQRTLLVLKISKELASAVSNLASAVRVVLMLKASSALLRGAEGALTLENGAVRLLRLARTAEGIAGKVTKVAQGLDVAISAYEAGDLFLNPDSALSRAGQAGDAETYRLQATRGALLGTSAAVGLAGLTGVLALSWAGPIGVGIGVAILAVDWAISDRETEYYSLRTQVNEQFRYEYRYDPASRTFVSGSVMQMKALCASLRSWG